MRRQRTPVFSFIALCVSFIGAAFMLPQALDPMFSSPVFAPPDPISGAALMSLTMCGLALVLGLAGSIRHEGTLAILACLGAPAAAYASLSLWNVGEARRERQWGASGRIEAFAVLPDGKVLVAGRGIARLEPDGREDASFQPWSKPEPVPIMARLPKGQILYGDAYDKDLAAHFIGRMSRDGVRDSSFSVPRDPCQRLYRIVSTMDGGALMQCSELEGEALDSTLVRLDVNGKIAKGFWKHGQKKHITAIAAQGDGRFALVISNQSVDAYDSDGNELWRFLAGGGVSLEVTSAESGGYYVYGWGTTPCRLTAEGMVDPAFLPEEALTEAGIGHKIDVLRETQNGDLIVVGNRKMVRLHTDGSLDPTFHSPQIDGWPDFDEVQMQGERILLLTPDGILSRFAADGTPDKTFAVPNL